MSRVRYEYRCSACSTVVTLDAREKDNIERFYRHRADPRIPCPSCDGELRRVWGASIARATVPGFHAHDAHGKAPG